ncbi:TetR/AcrR family transcriptional regulator [Granulicoccus sp. GXG6511]|uniref:TetR/AcrR family transcriptional regulator n=1 Tax=Granulicoccus sp. GXG6511 TaxID=3381351 RepID=UPI003D7C9F55
MSARRLQTRQRLMEAAARVFEERGIEGASVEEISEAAGFTRGAFYSNFESKDDLCFALLRSLSETFLTSVRVTLEQITPPGGAQVERANLVDTAVDIFLATQPQERHIVVLLMEMQLYALRHPEFAEIHSALNDETHRIFAGVLDTALANQGLALSLPTDQVVEILHAVHNATQASSLVSPAAPDRLASQLKTVLGALLR